MGFGLFFVPLIGGYLFLTRCNYTRFLLERQTGYRLLFNSASVGILLVMSAWLVTEAVDCLVPSVGVIGAKLVPIPYAGTAALAFALGPFSAMLVNVWYTDTNGAMRAVDAAHNEMESLFISSVKANNLVEVTLENGKVYVGWIVNADVPELDREFVAISPLISGFRNEKQEIVFTVNYANVYVSMYGKDWGSQVDRVYFRIVLPVSTLQSARLFDVDIYLRFKNIGEPSQDSEFAREE